MRLRMAARLVRGLLIAIAAMGLTVSTRAQDRKIQIGVIFDLTGPLAGGGSEFDESVQAQREAVLPLPKGTTSSNQ